MTNEEAIKELEWVKECGFVADKGIVGTDRIVDAISKAIEALEKQIPKRVRRDKYGLGLCPNCGQLGVYDVEANELDYCSDCGQAIDWGRGEE